MGQKRKPTGSNAIQQGPPKKQKAHKAETPKAIYLFEPRPDWHAADLPATEQSNEVKTLPASWITDALLERGMNLLQNENATYNRRQLEGSSHKFLSTIMSSGTLEDKISALTLLVQESPLHTIKAFENLLGLAKKRSRNQALMAVAALKDLLGQGALLPERKLRAFAKQPAILSALQGFNASRWNARDAAPAGLQDVHLMVWAYEDWLKKKYFELLQTLESWCGDEVAYARSRAVTYVWELLKDKPEQEDNLLRLLVNKLGDTDGKIASRASHLLLQLQISHPAMKPVIIDSISSECLFRPGQSDHAKYYATITLNQTVLSQKEATIANNLLEVYFSLFVQLLKSPTPPTPNVSSANQGGGGKPGKLAAKKRMAELKAAERSHEAGAQARDKLLAQVLTGVNRAFLFADATDLENQIDPLFRITHSANFNTAVQALMLLQRITSAKQSLSERYYRTLYESLLDPRLINSSKQVMYLNLLYKSLKADVDIKRVQAFVKRLLQVLSVHETPFICSVLYLLSELIQTFPSIRRMITEPEIEDEEEHFYDAPEDTDNITRTLQSASLSSIQYDPRKRDPTHANAGATALWDILPTLVHFHPSVAVFAEAICGDRPLPPKPDPAAHSLLHFLDKFMYRNPKSKASTHGTSIMQPSAGSAAADLLVKPISQAATYLAAMPVNNEAFWQKKVEDVAPEDIFFHSYFNQGGKKRRSTKKKAQDADSDESGEEEIWQAIAHSRPDVEGPGSDDDDLSMGDLDSAYGDSDSDGGIDLGGEEDEVDNGDDVTSLEIGSGSEDEIPELESDDGDALFDDEDEVQVDQPGDEDNASKGQDKRKNRRKFKQLPTFASADDYAKLLADDDDD